MRAKAKKLLFLIDQPPRRHDLVRESVDLILGALALDQTVTVVFVGDGVYHCLTPDSRPQRDPSAAFGSLDLYDIDALLVETESLREHGLLDAPLRFEPELISRRELTALMREQDLNL